MRFTVLWQIDNECPILRGWTTRIDPDQRHFCSLGRGKMVRSQANIKDELQIFEEMEMYVDDRAF